MKFQLYLEVTNKNIGDAFFGRTSITFPVRKPTTERLPLLYHTIGYCGRLTICEKVSLPRCKTLPPRHRNLMLCCSIPARSPPRKTVVLLCLFLPCKLLPVEMGGSDVIRARLTAHIGTISPFFAVHPSI